VSRAVLVALASFGCMVAGCTSGVDRTIVVTATPVLSSRHQTVLPTPSPTTGAGTGTGSNGITLTHVDAQPASVPVLGSVTLTYTIVNGNTTAVNAFLGATIYSDQNSANEWSDPSSDVVVSLAPGTGTYNRQFNNFPVASAGQTYDVLASVADASHQRLYDEQRYPAILTVTGASGSNSTPTPIPSSPQPGGFTDPATGMTVTISDVQGTFDATGAPAAVFYVRITNGGSVSHDYNPLDFTCVDQADQEHRGDAFLAAPFSNAGLSSGAIYPGDSRAGWDGCNMDTSSRLRITWTDGYNLSPAAHVWP
jgi:hypothetical protein